MKTKRFKQTDIGPIPEDWEVKTFAACFDVGSSKRVFQSQWTTSGIPFYRARDIVGFNNGEGAVGGLYISPQHYESLKEQYGVPKIGDILVTAVGTLGIVYLVEDNHQFYFKDGNIIWLKRIGDVDSKYLCCLFRSGRLDGQICDTSGGSTVGTYTITNAKKTLFAFPPLPEQRRIAVALGDVDSLLATYDALIEKKRKIKVGAMQELLEVRNVQTGLTGFTGLRDAPNPVNPVNPVEKLVPRRRLPGFSGAWVEKRLGDVLSIGNGKDYKCLRHGDIPVYGTGGLMTYVDSYLHDGPTVCIGRKGTIDQPQYHEGKIWTVDTLYYTYDFHDADPKYLFYVFTRIDWRSYNAATGVPSLTANSILKIEVVIPPTLAEQRAIAGVLSDMDAEIAELEREREKTRRIREGMMQELLTGRVRLEVA